MADDEPTGREAVVAALMGTSERGRYVPPPTYRPAEIEALSARLQAQSNAQNEARGVIYGAISKWAHIPVEPGGPIPIVRDGQVVEWRPNHPFLDHIAPILRGATRVPVSQLKIEEKQLKNLLAAAEKLRHSLEALDVEFSFTLDRTWKSSERGRGEPLDMVHALGIQQALTISLHGATRNIRQRLTEIEEDLALQRSKRGRPRVLPSYEVAKEFARLYAQITGKRPTCSASHGMVYGEFAPELRDLFDVFGWTDIRGPGDAAVEAITDEYLLSIESPKKGMFGGLFGLGQ